MTQPEPLAIKFATALLCLMSCALVTAQPPVHHGQGEMAGEVTDTTAILQSRLTQRKQLVDGEWIGSPGIARFEISTNDSFPNAQRTEWIRADARHDYIIKTKVVGLKPETRYFYRLQYGANKQNTQLGQCCSFKTLNGPHRSSPIRFVVVTGMNYAFFHHGKDHKGQRMYTGPDKHLGYPALATILEMKPDFFIGTGDNVYYDHPAATRARTQKELRKKWHEQFAQPRFVDLFSQVPTYWEKDDHDYRFNDSDPQTPVRGSHKTPADSTNPALAKQPSDRLGVRTFWEQVPVVDPLEKNPVTYRTHRVTRDLQIWLVEGRDYRSPNEMPDGPQKTLWGKQQIRWLKKTLLETDAAFKILISPTPLIGPDSAKKQDSHANIGGFQHEADIFFAWLTEQGFQDRNFYLICGDRHWQYHAVHPNGLEEFSCGAICDANASSAIAPGQPGTTDPQGLIQHKHTQRGLSGGFLKVDTTPADINTPARIEFSFHDELGKILYRELKTATK